VEIIEVEEIHQVADGGSVERDVGVGTGDRVVEVVPASGRKRAQVPIGSMSLRIEP
jgi:hypothetical protein